MAGAKCAFTRVVSDIRKLARTRSHRDLQAIASALDFTLREMASIVGFEQKYDMI